MSRKTRGQRACAQTLAIVQQKHLDNRLGGCSVDPGAGHIDPETAGNGGSFLNVGPNDSVLGSVGIEVDNSPGNGADPNALSIGSDESDDLDLVEQTALQWFASALQEAQKLTVQLERDEAQQNLKHKTPKTYRGSLRMTLYCHKKARKLLASEGFLDIRSFMELKEREQEERECLSNTAATADQTMSGGPMEENEDDNEIFVLPGPVDCA
ncbi:hypothetical protein EDB92DRAFT_1816923 [Lactarius akahatsu]|uniref:Uncharacterized protein n=1 Tax=Lactarius akahatsu TaxID=416441 RepID=A0AAD4Q7B8_9AGAM|nr:hypothetical protein EDB92DRAFT_1816923 [Lactarius akahatsu]